MRNVAVLAIALAALASAQQPVTRTVHLVNIGNSQGLQEAATVLRTVCDLRTVSVDTSTSSISFTDTPDTVALAEWTLTAIDAAGPMAAQQYNAPNGADDITKVVYLTNTNSAQGIQELLTQLRTVVDLAKVFNVTAPRAIAFRGSASTIAASSWLIAQLDKPFQPNAQPVSYEMAGAVGGDQVRVYYLHNIASPKPTQELLTAIRMQTKAGHAFVSTGPRAIAVRATSDQITAANAIVAQHDIPGAQ
jgi:hypothetical protein